MSNAIAAPAGKNILSTMWAQVPQAINATKAITGPQAAVVVAVVVGAAVVVHGGVKYVCEAAEAGTDVDFTCGPIRLCLKPPSVAA